jgi:outer membrane protein assembly factor BamB
VPVHGENEAAALSDFAVAGSRIIFAEGGSRLRALDAQTGGVAWSFEPTQGTLGPRFQCNQELVVLQTLSPGRLVTLDTLSGRVRYERELGDAPWPRVPLLADASQLYVVSDRVHVQRFDARRGDLLWETSGPSSPANGPPDVLGDAAHLLVVLNGYILERVDPDTGKVLWQKGLGTEPLANPRDLTAVDATNVYCVSRGELKAFRLSDGKLVWSQRVGAQGAWRVERLFDYVVCYPASQVDRSIAGQAALSAPVSFFRPEDGRPVQQLNFFGAGGQFNVQFLPQATVVADRETVWALDALERHP